MPAGKKQVIVNFPAIDRETKGTKRYSEEERDDDKRPVIGKLYVSNEAVEQLGNPEAIKVTIEAV